MTVDIGNSWREVYVELGCSPDAHEEEPPEGEATRRAVGVVR